MTRPRAPRPPPPPGSTPARPPPARGGKLAPILVIEDDVDVREMLVTSLVDAGLPVLASDEGRKALELAAAIAPSAIVLDLAMPGMNGREFLARRRADPVLSGIPVVVVTAGDAGDVEAAHVVQKPFEAAALVALLRKLVRG